MRKLSLNFLIVIFVVIFWTNAFALPSVEVYTRMVNEFCAIDKYKARCEDIKKYISDNCGFKKIDVTSDEVKKCAEMVIKHFSKAENKQKEKESSSVKPQKNKNSKISDLINELDKV